MLIYRAILTLIVCTCFFIGCAPAGNIQTEDNSLGQFKDVHTVAVASFACSDPLIAWNVQNSIIEELLGSFSVVIGQETDVVVKGIITLSSKKNVSEINADIIKNERIVDSVTVTQPDNELSPEAMGRKTGIRIKEKLSRL